MQDRPGWVLFTEEIGRDPQNRSGRDYTPWTDQGFWPIVRLNNGYGSTGTIPLVKFYSDFAQRCANFVEASRGPIYWIIGNEPNHSQERPDGIPIQPDEYADCYLMARRAIKNLTGHRGDYVLTAAVAPWNIETGEWYKYFDIVLNRVRFNCDGITLHTYTHHWDPQTIMSPLKMSPPYQEFHFDFQAYRDLLARVPSGMRSLPCLITEMNQVPSQGGGWWNQHNTWIESAYEQIDAWNLREGSQKIQGALVYRWPTFDQWFIQGKEEVERDFRRAVLRGFRSSPTLPDEIRPVEPAPVDYEVFIPGIYIGTAITEEWLVISMSRVFQVEKKVFDAMVKIESGGRSFESGRMIIRFENHVFETNMQRLSPNLVPEIRRFFKYGTPKHTGHQWRRSENMEWQNCHYLGQKGEWEVFEFAASFHDTAAKQAVSMGRGQVLGTNFTKVGYATVQQMFTDYGNSSVGSYNQLIGMFAYCHNTPGLVLALRQKNWREIARLYNGEGNMDVYAHLLEQAYLAP